VFGNLGARNKASAEELELLDRSEEVRRLFEEEKERRRILVSNLEALFYKRKFVGDRNRG
jgi:hypothetical protein